MRFFFDRFLHHHFHCIMSDYKHQNKMILGHLILMFEITHDAMEMILGHFCDTHGPSVIFSTEQLFGKDAKRLLEKSNVEEKKNETTESDQQHDDDDIIKIPPCAMCFSFAEGK